MHRSQNILHRFAMFQCMCAAKVRCVGWALTRMACKWAALIADMLVHGAHRSRELTSHSCLVVRIG